MQILTLVVKMTITLAMIVIGLSRYMRLAKRGEELASRKMRGSPLWLCAGECVGVYAWFELHFLACKE